MNGYETQNVTFQVSGDEATVVNVTLRRLAVSKATRRTEPATTTESVVDESSMTTNTEPGTSPDYSGDGSTSLPTELSFVMTTTESADEDEPSTFLEDPAAGDDYVEVLEEPVPGAVFSSASSLLTCTFPLASTFSLVFPLTALMMRQLV